MTRLRVLLADDQRMFLADLQKLLEDEFDVLGAVEDGREPIGAADQFDPDLSRRYLHAVAHWHRCGAPA